MHHHCEESRHLLLADMLNAAAMGADLVEVRLDCLENAPNFADMLSAKRLPILFSCRRAQDGGQWKGSEEERLMLLRQAIMSKADYVDIEYDVADQVRPFPGCKRVISYTNVGKMPSAIGDIYDDMLALKPDVDQAYSPRPHAGRSLAVGADSRQAEGPDRGRRPGPAGLMLAVLGKKIGASWTGRPLNAAWRRSPASLRSATWSRSIATATSASQRASSASPAWANASSWLPAS